MFQSEGGTTVVLPVVLADNLEISEINETVTGIQEVSESILVSGTIMITGPAGIASDTIAIFSNADLVLLFSTIVLVLILLIVIYRSPLLAIIPIIAVEFVYQVVDRVLGMFAASGAFTNEAQSSLLRLEFYHPWYDYNLPFNIPYQYIIGSRFFLTKYIL